MIASLPMYDWPELASSTDALWKEIANGLREHGIAGPEYLTRSDDDETHWLTPNLLFGQTCGYPFSTRLKGKVAYVATPEYAVEGCNGATYSSAVIALKSSDVSLQSMSGKRFAYNSTCSLSGYRCMRAMVGELEIYFGESLVSGGHRQSARMIANGTADVAAIDAVCWHMLREFEPETAANLKVIGWTKPYPALPYITSLETSSKRLELLRQVLKDVFSRRQDNPGIQQLAIAGCRVLDVKDYDQLAML
jgi:ABC-type phosphate/phosphonate transport system substrate-binding protein